MKKAVVVFLMSFPSEEQSIHPDKLQRSSFVSVAKFTESDDNKGKRSMHIYTF